MDYAIQLFVILALFTYGGVWAHDNWGWPKWAILLCTLVGGVMGMLVLYRRITQETPDKPIDPSKLKPYVEDPKEDNDEDK